MATAAKEELPKLSKDKFLDFLKDRRRRSDECMQFPCVILFFVMFTITVLFHEDISNVSQVERNFRGMLEGTSFEGTGVHPNWHVPVSGHKTMGDIDVVDDVWTYMYEAIIPLFIMPLPTNFVNFTAYPDLGNLYRTLRYNQLIGGVQLQQIRRKAKQCSNAYPDLGPKAPGTDTNPLLAGVICYPWNEYSAACFGEGSTEDQAPPGYGRSGWCPDQLPNNTTTTRRLTALPPQGVSRGRRLESPKYASRVQGQTQAAIMFGGMSKFFEGGTYSVLLKSHEGLDAAWAKLWDLQQKIWLDPGTAWFGMKFFILNPDLAVYTHIIMNVYFAPGGQLIPAVTINSFPAEPYQNMSTAAADAVWGVLLLYLIVNLVGRCVRAKKTKTFKTLFTTLWTWVDLFAILGGLLIIILWAVFLLRLSVIQAQVMDVGSSRPVFKASVNAIMFPDATTGKAYDVAVEALHAELTQLAGFLMNYRLIICWYTIGIMVRFFQAFHSQPKLAVVTNTIANSITDVVHFLLVLVICFISFAVSGMFLFGNRMLEFAEFPMALNTCFLLMLGDFDYDTLGEDDPLTTAIWFWTYIIIMSQIMLNMTLAIIMDVYTEVKMDADASEAIWTQMATMIRNVWVKREWVGMGIVQEEVVRLEQDTIDVQTLLDIVPNMSRDQAEELIGQNIDRERAAESAGLTMSDAMKMVGWIKIHVKKIAKKIDDVIKIEKDQKALITSAAHVNALKTIPGETMVNFTREVALDKDAERSLQLLDRRLAQMEEFLNEHMSAGVQRGKEIRNRLKVVEDIAANPGPQGAGQSYMLTNASNAMPALKNNPENATMTFSA